MYLRGFLGLELFLSFSRVSISLSSITEDELFLLGGTYFSDGSCLTSLFGDSNVSSDLPFDSKLSCNSDWFVFNSIFSPFTAFRLAPSKLLLVALVVSSPVAKSTSLSLVRLAIEERYGRGVSVKELSESRCSAAGGAGSFRRLLMECLWCGEAQGLDSGVFSCLSSRDLSWLSPLRIDPTFIVRIERCKCGGDVGDALY